MAEAANRGGNTSIRLRIVLYTLLFFAATALTVALTRYGGGLALVWPGTAIAAALLLHLPKRAWPLAVAAIAAASMIATALFGLGPSLAIPLAVVNVMEAYLVARLLLYMRPKRDWFDSVGGLFAFIMIGGFAVPAAAAWPGAWTVSQVVPGTLFYHAESWWAGHALGTLIGLPMMLIMTSAQFGAWDRWPTRRMVELAGHLLLIGAIATFAIGQSRLPLLFLPALPLLLAAFRAGREGAVLGLLVIAGAAAATMHSSASPLAAFELDIRSKVLFVQFYLATLSLMAIPISVALRQHQLLLAELDGRKALTRLVADHADVALLNLGPRGTIRYASPAAAELVEEAEDTAFVRLFDPLDEALVRETLAEAARAPGATVTLERPVFRGDEQVWLHARICAIATEDKPAAPQGYAVTIRDVTARKQAELAVLQEAETDALTGLPNRRALMRQLDRALTHAIVDLDHFKAVNDTHGHNVGDMVLREVAGAMRRLARPGQLFARLGGEEFALVAADAEAAQSLCEALRRAITALTLVGGGGQPIRLTASIGLLTIDMPTSPGDALEAADRLLYRAKSLGRDRVVTPATLRRAA